MSGPHDPKNIAQIEKDLDYIQTVVKYLDRLTDAIVATEYGVAFERIEIIDTFGQEKAEIAENVVNRAGRGRLEHTLTASQMAILLDRKILPLLKENIRHHGG